MRIRTYPAVGFGALILASAYLGLAPSTIPSYKQSDKVLHFVTFFLLTACFYWIVESNKRKNLQLTIVVCTLGLGVGSEIAQALLPNGRIFDIFDIAANIAGSGAGVGACLWYHKRMLERKRRSKTNLAPGEGGDDDDYDVELGESLTAQEDGVIHDQSLEDEVENWDENAEDWDDDEPTTAGSMGEDSTITKTPNSEEVVPEPKIRND